MSKALNIEGVIGTGVTGTVFKVTSNGEVFAMKKFDIDKQYGMPLHLVREIKALKRLKSPMIVELKNIIIEKDYANLILDYMPYNLEYLISSGFILTEAHFNAIYIQLMRAVSFIHSNGIIHRDLKPAHILLDSKSNLKLADFGQSRDASENMTNKVTSLYYRAPELLLGETKYTDKVDSWSVGCILVEMKMKKPLFAGEDEITQCKLILNTLGRPEDIYPWNDLFNVQKYPKCENWSKILENKIGDLFDEKISDVIKELLQIDHQKRLSITNVKDMVANRKINWDECGIKHKEREIEIVDNDKI